jgi:pimeloyl-ACP methyl ester carboxylesterase
MKFKAILRWYFIVPVVAVVLFAIARIAIPAWIKPPEQVVFASWHRPGEQSKELFVVIHGYTAKDDPIDNPIDKEGKGSLKEELEKTSMSDVISTITEKRADADVVLMQYPCDALSNADCSKISYQICDLLEKRFTEHPYERITLVGHSMGALLARKAYVYGYGHLEDFGTEDQAIQSVPPIENVTGWVKSVDRFVLLAGTNRGWSGMEDPKGNLWPTRFSLKTAKFVGWAFDVGRLIRQCEKGEPFVANLRLQWLDVMRDIKQQAITGNNVKASFSPGNLGSTGNPNMTEEAMGPAMVQLLGSDDDVVSSEDSRDLGVCSNFIWVQLGKTTHTNAIKFTTTDEEKKANPEEEKVAKDRGKWFAKAIGTPDDVKDLRRMSPESKSEDDSEITEAVVVLHGIRDYGGWTADFFSPLQESFLSDPERAGKLLVYRPTYGYFPMGSFLLPIERQDKVRWFMDEMTELKTKYPKLDTIHFVGHSNGTYVLGTALREYKALKVKNVVLAGSVLRRDFNWESPGLAGRVSKVHNFVATGDWVVACFPHLFETWPFTHLKNNIGGAGHLGFTHLTAQNGTSTPGGQSPIVTETKWVEGGHDAALKREDRIESMKQFILDGSPVAASPGMLGERSGFVEFLGAVPFLAWLVILAILVGLGWLWHKGMGWLLRFVFKTKAASVVAIASYCLFIAYVMQNV